MLALKSKPNSKTFPSLRNKPTKPIISPTDVTLRTGFNPALLQPKLKIGRPNDKYEQEADRVADEVLRMPNPMALNTTGVNTGVSNSSKDSANGSSSIRRKCDACEMDEDLIQTKTNVDSTPEVTPALTLGLQSLQGGGKPLSKSEREFYEPRFGADFSQVRIHTSSSAAETANSINARAFTIGKNIAFGTGQYMPESQTGKRLLGHELTHVIQQQEKGGLITKRDNVPTHPFQQKPTHELSKSEATYIQRSEKDTKQLCPIYWRYNKSIKTDKYNCAGLSHRTYSYIGMISTRDLLKKHEASKCKSGHVKHWFWLYKFHLENYKGQITQKPIPGFHTVAGVVDKKGNDPTDVYSKNGKRPVEGPGTGSSFKPKAKEHATKNTLKAELIYDKKKKPIYKVRKEFQEWHFCKPCPKPKKEVKPETK